MLATSLVRPEIVGNGRDTARSLPRCSRLATWRPTRPLVTGVGQSRARRESAGPSPIALRIAEASTADGDSATCASSELFASTSGTVVVEFSTRFVRPSHAISSATNSRLASSILRLPRAALWHTWNGRVSATLCLRQSLPDSPRYFVGADALIKAGRPILNVDEIELQLTQRCETHEVLKVARTLGKRL